MVLYVSLPSQYAAELHKETCKLFADLAIVRQEMEMREMNERKKQRQEEIAAEEKQKLQKEWNKNYEVCIKMEIPLGGGKWVAVANLFSNKFELGFSCGENSKTRLKVADWSAVRSKFR